MSSNATGFQQIPYLTFIKPSISCFFFVCLFVQHKHKLDHKLHYFICSIKKATKKWSKNLPVICWLMKLSGTLVLAKNSRASFFCMISKHPLSSFGFSWTPQQAHLNLEFEIQPVCQETCVSQLLEIGENEIFFVVKRSSKTILWGNYPKTFFL